MDAYDDGEPDEWPAEHAALSELDTSLRCGICKGVLNTPLRQPACVHVFCSECFRSWQAQPADVQCPACREARLASCLLLLRCPAHALFVFRAAV